MNVRGLALDVSVCGSGPPMLLLNGLGARLSLFEQLRSHLPHSETIAFNQPGIGDSQPADAMSMGDYAQLAIGVLDELDVRQPVDLFGVSWGGCLAQEVAFRYPQRVRRLVLASTTASPIVFTTPSVYRAFLSSSRFESSERHREVAATLYGGRLRRDPSLVDALRPHLDGGNSRGRRSQFRAAIGWTSVHYAWRLQQPTLVLAADDDPVIRPYNAYMLAAMIPNATLRILRNEGHLCLLTSAPEVAEHVSRFLKTYRVSARGFRSAGRRYAAGVRRTST
jgi:pimeloyl-ACP methyl ester carboxylesterase